MYKVFNNYPRECELSELMRITMENIKTFICDIAPKAPFTATTNINTPIPSSSGMPNYILETTPLIFYSDVVDNTNPDFLVDAGAKFKISDIADTNYPVYCIFYSWMPHPLLIFIASQNSIAGYNQSSFIFPDSGSLGGCLCIAFDLSLFNVDASTDMVGNYDYRYVYCHRLVKTKDPVDGLSYEDASIKSSPILIFNPLTHNNRGINNFSLAISLYNGTFVMYSLYNHAYKGASEAYTLFIAKLDRQLVHGCDLSVPEDAIICKSDGLAHMTVESVNDSSASRRIFLNGSNFSAMSKLKPSILGAYADSNIGNGSCNLYNWNNNFDIYSYRNFYHYTNPEKTARKFKYKSYLLDTDSDKWVGGCGYISEHRVPTLYTPFQPSYGIEDYIPLSRFDAPFFPTLTNGYSGSHNQALLKSMSTKVRDESKDFTVFTYGFPTQTSNTLNNHFIAYPINIYIIREPVELGNVSLYCTLNFMYASQRLYDDDDRLHEYNYLDKKFVGISNRYSCLLFLVDENEDVIV